jgi:hypothetical protein
MDFTYLYKIEQWNFLQLLEVGQGGGLGGDDGRNLTNVQYKPIWYYHNEFPLYNKYILIKFFLKNQVR